MPHPAQPSAGTPSTGYSICYYTLPDQVLDVITLSTGYSKCYTLPVQVLDAPRRRGNYNKSYTLPINGVQHTLPDQVLDVITPSTGYSKCYTLPDQVLMYPVDGVITTNATPCPTKCWHPVDGVQHMLLHPARPPGSSKNLLRKDVRKNLLRKK